ncbi:hypothetical protein Chor_010468 [Crotalus horridus]
MVGFKPSDVPPTATVKFLGAGTAACIADLITFPLDTAKVRLQYKGVFGTMATMVRNEGPKSLYNGLVAGLQRQMSFASVRIGLYDSPTDVVKVRFQAQIRTDAGRRYQGTLHAYKTIAKEEGVRGLWKGTLPNVSRNAIVNCAELVTYDIIKDTLLKHRLMTDDVPCHFLSAFGAGFCTTIIASPVDVVKTRYMNSPPGQYKNAGQCALTMLRAEGPLAFYKG